MAEHSPQALIDALARLERLAPRADISVSTRSGGGLLIAWGGVDADALSPRRPALRRWPAWWSTHWPGEAPA
jgi:hypothetical protein